ncbi:MAG: histidine kinase [Betaproteobacteria bacterium]|nr:histidine kinase [Betaproteobacteria bacterium]
MNSPALPAPDRLALIERARRHVLAEGAAQGGVEPWIERSWRRCLANGQRPEQHVSFDLVSAATARRTRDEAHGLAAAARPLMEKLSRTIAQTHYFAVLTNADGVVVDVGPSALLTLPQARLIARVGVDLSERAIGTSAIGAALTELQPVWLHRGEHFFADTGVYSCAGAPIFDPRGRCAGMLDLTGINTQERPELRHVVTHFARAIENAWVATQPHRLLVQLNWPGRAPGHDDDGLVALDADGVLVGTNSAARQMLGTPPDAAHAQDLFALQADLLFDAARRGASLEVPLWSGLRVLACPVLAGAGHAVRQLPAALPTGPGTPLRQIEADLIRQAVDEAHGNVATAARRLGVSRATVYRKLASLVRGRIRKV